MALAPNSVEFKTYLALTIVIVTVKLVLVLIFGRDVYRVKKETGSIQINFTLAAFALMIFLFISRLFLIYFDFYLTELNPNLFYVSPNIMYWKIGIVMSNFGVAFIVLITDKVILNFRLKGVPFIMMISTIFIVFFYPVNNAEDFSLLSLFLVIPNFWFAMVPLIFFYISIKKLEFRKIALVIAFGLIIFPIGPLIINEYFTKFMISLYGEQYRLISFFLFSFFKLTGLLMISYGFWRFSNLLSGEQESIDESSIKWIKKMGVPLMRPENLTDEDIAFYREQTICLVCKNTLRGFSSLFICPACRALYCENCARTLANLENLCWSCNDPIDKSKPVQSEATSLLDDSEEMLQEHKKKL